VQGAARPVVLVASSPGGAPYFALKRAMDVLLVLLLSPLALPIVLVVGIIVRIDSPGPALFTQQRISARRRRRGGDLVWELQPFTFYKLRTMARNADPTLHRTYLDAYIAGDEEAIERLNEGGSDGSYKLAKDPRVTRVGATIRALSLDELPQLWNVLKGDMSLVGPRPPIDYEVERYSKDQLQRLAGPAGLTGWWQVNGRATVTFEEMVALDTSYLSQRSLLHDLTILVRTLGVVVKREGAG
jgi:lipopolysaccharide/colanic/teichoic acid biosynthesis glycosyltransferase